MNKTCQRVVRFKSGKISRCPDPNRGTGFCSNHAPTEKEQAAARRMIAGQIAHVS